MAFVFERGENLLQNGILHFKFSQSSRNRVSKLEFTHDFLKGWHLKGYAVSTCVYMKGEVNRQTAFHGKKKKKIRSSQWIVTVLHLPGSLN